MSKLPSKSIIHIRSVSSIIVKIAKKYNIPTIVHSHSTSNGTGIKSILIDHLQYFGTKKGL